jgi:hypothetical protein
MSSIGLDEGSPSELGLGVLADVAATEAGAFRGWTRLSGSSFYARLTPIWRSRLACPSILRRGLVVALGALMLMWSALLNGRPAVFFDTACRKTRRSATT